MDSEASSDVYKGYNFGFLPTTENLTKLKLFGIKDHISFQTKVEHLQRAVIYWLNNEFGNTMIHIFLMLNGQHTSW